MYFFLDSISVNKWLRKITIKQEKPVASRVPNFRVTPVWEHGSGLRFAKMAVSGMDGV